MRALIRLPLFALFAAAGCGSLSHTVDRDLLLGISIESRLVLFDAENEVSIAVDERDKLQRRIRQARKDLRDTEHQLHEADSDRERAEARGDAAAVRLAEQARAVFELEYAYLEESLEHLRDTLDAQDDRVTVALARYELAKAKLVKRNNVEGAGDIEVEVFEEQVQAHLERAKERKAELEEQERQLEGLRAQWLEKRRELMAASGGGLGSPWAEDSALWQR